MSFQLNNYSVQNKYIPNIANCCLFKKSQHIPGICNTSFCFILKQNTGIGTNKKYTSLHLANFKNITNPRKLLIINLYLCN